MGKRSNFKRRKCDAYPTIDSRAVRALWPHLAGVLSFAEPCAGEGRLVQQLVAAGLVCVHQSDLERDGVDALQLDDFADPDVIITNTPWTRSILHAMIRHFQCFVPTWLLFDADWAFNEQATPYLDSCSDIVAVGRLKWVEGSAYTGKDNVAWYRFWHLHSGGPRFHNRRLEWKSARST